jgi:hypothetical protein
LGIAVVFGIFTIPQVLPKFTMHSKRLPSASRSSGQVSELAGRAAKPPLPSLNEQKSSSRLPR